MQSSQTQPFTSHETTNITNHVNFSFEIGTRNDRPQGTARSRSETNQDERDTSARNEDETGKLQDTRHGRNQDLRSGNFQNSTNDLGNPRGIRPENECISGVQDIISQDYIPGEEAIGQYVNIDGKPKGIRPRSRKPMIVEPTPVL